VDERYRYRLLQYLQPREQKEHIYSYTTKDYTTINGIKIRVDVQERDATWNSSNWFKWDIKSEVNLRANCHILADNVVLLALLPMVTSGSGSKASPNYAWNSRGLSNVTQTRHRLPISIKLVMAVIDEASAARFDRPEFHTTDPAKTPIQLPEDLFTRTTNDQFEKDIQILDDLLSKQYRLNYRIFTAEIPLNATNTNLSN